MKKILPVGRFRIVLSVLGVCALIGIAWVILEQRTMAGQGDTGTLQKMIVANGSVAMDIDLNRLNGKPSQSPKSNLRFAVEQNAFFKILVFNGELRGPLPGSMGLIPQNSAALPSKLNSSYGQLVIESLPWGGQFELVVRDGKTGFIFFNIEGHQYDYAPSRQLFNIQMGRLLISDEFAAELGRPADAGSVVGEIFITATMRSIEVTQVISGEASSSVLPPGQGVDSPLLVPGPDVILGELSGLSQFGSDGTMVGLAVGTDSCNAGQVPLQWFANPDNRHPVIPQNLYRMSGGPANNERFEQIGQSSVKHAFTALQNNICGFGCTPTGGTTLGAGCSDPYGAGLNAGPSLGSRAWINPFTGFYPRNDSPTPNNNHSGHVGDNAVGHRIRTNISDLNTTLNPGATYYSEAQYITSHEYSWCQANPTQCNMYNNVSYRRYNVSGTTSFSFSAAGSTVRTQPAIMAWPGATLVEVRPDPGVDGRAFVAFKVTNPSAGVWHYEYAIYNENLDRAIQSFGVPIGAGVSVSNVGFHAPPQHPGSTFDGTVGNTGYSNAPWSQSQAGGLMTWGSETLSANENANAIRWGTMYNIRFDSNRPPATANATIGFFKTGSPITVQIQSPSAPTVAVSVTGRVTTSSGRGLSKVRVTMTDFDANVRTAITNSSGYYRFLNIAPGSYTFAVVTKRRYTFTPQTILVSDNLTNVDFVAAP